MKIPMSALEQHVAVLGKTRSGKSSVLRGITEGLLEQQLPVCIVDPKGDWWGIKLSRDGKRPGFPVVIFGGTHADVPINAHAGAHVAELFATGNRPCLIDLGGWMVAERTSFWIDFASTLFRLTRGRRWLIVDEVHNFAPKGKILDPNAGKSLHWTNRLASEGLGKGLAMLFASQRPQKVHNDTLTSAETLIAMRVLHPSDRAAVADWIKGCGDLDLGAKVLNSLAQMDRGEGWVWSPEIGLGPERVKFPMFKTYDSFRPQTAEDVAGLKGWADVDLEDVKAKLAAVVKEAEANDPKRLKAEIARLQRELAAKPAAAAAVDVRALEESARAEGQAYGYASGLQAMADKLEHLSTVTSTLLEDIQASRDEVSQLAKRELNDARLHAHQVDVRRATATRPPPAASQRQPAASQAVRGSSALPFGERKVLAAIAQHVAGVSREQLTVLTGYKRSSRDTYIQRLSAAGHVSIDGQTIHATASGVDALGADFEPLPTGRELRAHWLERLPEGERKCLAAVIEAFPDTVDRDVISQLTGYKRSSRDTYLQRLAARKLITTARDGIRASDQLF